MRVLGPLCAVWLLGAAVTGGCTGARVLTDAGLSRGMVSDSGSGDSSAGSGQSSGGSSDGSGQSSGASSGSSEASGGSSEASGESSGSTGEESSAQSSAESSAESSGGSSDATAAGSANVVAVLVPVSSTATLAGTTAGLFVLIWSQQNPPRPEAEAAAYLYLRSVRHRLEEELAFGAGPTLEELAGLAQIRRAHLPEFTRMLQRNRRELRALLDPGAFTPARAGLVLRRIGEWAAADPVLVEDARRAGKTLAERS